MSRAQESAQGFTLTVFRNDDTGLERPFVVTVPSSVDTLAELCQYLTAKVPLHNSDAEAPRGYRFLYTMHGKPLWRVKECIEARSIIVSVGPGFQPRRPQALADTAFDAVQAQAQMQAAQAPPQLTTPPSASAIHASAEAARFAESSTSPPVRRPVQTARNGQNTNTTAVYAPTEDASPPPKANGVAQAGSRRNSDGTLQRAPSAITAAEDILEPYRATLSLNSYPNTASSERAAQYRVSITRPRGPSGDGMPPVSHAPGAGASYGVYEVETAEPLEEDEEEEGVSGDEAMPTQRPTKRLFTPSEEAPDSAPRPSTAAPGPAYDPAAFAHLAADSAPSSTARTTVVARGQFYIQGHAYELPPAPVFLSREISDQLTEYVEEDEAFIHRLRLLLARKMLAAGELKRRDDREVLCRSTFSALHDRVMDQLTAQGGRSVCRVVVEGPARSGVSSTAALISEACLPDFARHRQFFNHLLFPLDLASVLGAATAATSTAARPGSPPLDLPLLFSVVIGALMDAVAVQRPALRAHSVLLFELWEKVLSKRRQTEAPDLLAYTQVATLVGFKVMSRWNALVQRVFPLLQAACADPSSGSLRDAALDVIFYAIPTEVAASLRFGGVLYCLDGLEHLCTGPAAGAPSRRATHADLSAALKPLWDDPHCNVLMAWPSAVPTERIFLPYTTRRVQTLGLLSLSDEEAAMAGLPQRIVVPASRQSYSLTAFLGAPGYLAQLLPLVRPRMLRTQLPTAAFSSAYQSIKKEQQARPFVLELDDADAAEALSAFRQATRAAAIA